MATIGNITFACQGPDRLADFWAAALGYVKQDAPPALAEAIEERGWDPDMAAAAVDPEGRGPRLFFQKKPKTPAPDARSLEEQCLQHLMPPSAPAESLPIHLDLLAEDREAEVSRLEGLGATVVAHKTQELGPFTARWTIMQDPEGNGFCVQGP